jgi:hypothetical protein
MFKRGFVCAAFAAVACFCSVEFSMASMPKPYISENEGENLSWYHETIMNPECGYRYFAPRSVEEVSTLHGICGSEEDSVLRIWGEVRTNIRNEIGKRCLDYQKPLITDYITNVFAPFIRATDEFYTTSRPPYAGMVVEDLSCFAGELEGIFKNPNTSFKGATRKSTHLHYTVREIDKVLDASVHFKGVGLLEWYEERYLGISRKSAAERQEDEKMRAAMLQAITQTFAGGFSPTGCLSGE